MTTKVWILDTDLGWDPDDIIALVILVQYIKISNDKLAIISSDESLENNKCEKSTRILEDIINIGSEKGSVYEENFNYFLTLSNV